MRPEILTFVRHYLPGYKSGGPIRTIANMVDHLGDEFNFRIITSDRDALDNAPYPNVSIDSWNKVGKAQVYYASPGNRSLRALAKLIASTSHEVMYLNSFFDPVFTLRPLLAYRLDWLPKRPVVIAPRGEFSPGALVLKRWKKRPYRVFTSAIGLYDNLAWQASSDYEAERIRLIMGATAGRIAVAPNLPPAPEGGMESNKGHSRREGPLKVVFLSRVTPMKNLDFALRVLAKVRIPLEFNIYGPVRDESYWQQCQMLMSCLPQNVSVRYAGTVEHSRVLSIFASHDLFFLPTRGENYGHVILESFSAGTPVLIADTTPWRDLEEIGVGWDLPLDAEYAFVDCIHRAAALSNEDYVNWRNRVRSFAWERMIDLDLIASNRRLFLEMTGRMGSAEAPCRSGIGAGDGMR